MPTNDRKVNIYPKRLLSLTAIKNEFLDYLQDSIDEVGSAFFAGSSGTLDQDKIGLNNAHGGSTFDIDTTNAQRVLAGNHTVDLTAITGAGITHTIPFENTAASVYYIGIFYAEVEVGLEVNPRTGDAEYSSLKQTFGKVDNPTSVTDNTTYIRVNVNSICESGVNHSGRKCRIWLTPRLVGGIGPASAVEAVAFYEGTIAYSAPNNYVDIPYSGANGPLGQNTGSAPPSTTATDYKVFIEGVIWRKNTDLRSVSGCSFLGTATGGSPPTFSVTDQQLLQIISLDRAYDGIPGPGNGRAIDVDAGAVELNTDSAGPDDVHNAQLRLSRLDSTDYFQLSLEVLMGDVSSIPLLLCQQFGAIQDETVNLLGDTITFSGVNPLNWYLDKDVQFIWIKTGVYAGVYAFISITSSTIVCRDFQTGASPGWASTTGVVCSVMQPRMVFSNGTPSAASAIAHWRGLLLPGIDGNGNSTEMLTLAPSRGTGELVKIKNNRVSFSTGMLDQRDMVLIDFDTPAVGSPGGRMQLGKWVGTVGSEAGVHTKIGFDFRPLVQGTGAADKYAFNVKPQPQLGDTIGGKPCTRQMGLHDASGVEHMRWTPFGRMADTHRFIERFDYIGAGGFLPGSERWYQTTSVNGGTVYWNDTGIYGSGLKGQGDILHCRTAGVASGDGVMWEGAACWILRATGGTNRKLKFYARARGNQVNQCVWYGVGIFSGLVTNNVIQFRVYDTANVGTNWELHCRTNGGSDNYGPAATFDSSSNWNNDSGWCDFYFEVDTAGNYVNYWMTGMSSMSGMNIKVGGLGASDWLDMRVQPFWTVRQVGVLGTNARQFEIDHMEVWDENIVAGTKE